MCDLWPSNNNKTGCAAAGEIFELKNLIHSKKISVVPAIIKNGKNVPSTPYLVESLVRYLPLNIIIGGTTKPAADPATKMVVDDPLSADTLENTALLPIWVKIFLACVHKLFCSYHH